MNCYIKENSWVAKLAARKLKARAVAIVVGKTIHLHNASRDEFLHNQSWVRHEVKHLLQYREYGLLRFITKYLLESIRRGYHNNKFEVEARAAEKDEAITSGVNFL